MIFSRRLYVGYFGTNLHEDAEALITLLDGTLVSAIELGDEGAGDLDEIEGLCFDYAPGQQAPLGDPIVRFGMAVLQF